MNNSNDENQLDAIKHFLNLTEVNSLLAPFSLATIQLLCTDCNQPLDSILVRGQLTKSKDSGNSIISAVKRCQICDNSSIITLLIFKSKKSYILFQIDKTLTGYSQIATITETEKTPLLRRIQNHLKKVIRLFRH